jgi:hypothetical protein
MKTSFHTVTQPNLSSKGNKETQRVKQFIDNECCVGCGA